MYKPSRQQLDSLIDMIVEAVVRELEEENQVLLTANAASPVKERRGVLETQHDDSN
jgi:hypothetical protein